MNEALLLYGLFSLFSLHSLLGTKDPMLNSINPNTKRELLKGHYPEADAQLTAAIRIDSLNPTLYYLRGVCRGRLEQWPAAKTDFTHAIRLDSTDGWFYVGRANCHFALRHLQLARRDYALAFKRTPSCHSDPDVAAQAGVTHLFLNELPQAAEELELASVLDRRNDFALFYLTVARTINHKPQAAAASCQEYIKWHAKRPEGYVNRALLQASLGKYQPALADITLALSLDPTHTGSDLAKIVVTELSGNTADATALLASVVAKSSNKGSIYLDLGDYYMQAGKNAAANQQWTTAQLLGNAEAAERLAAQFQDAP
jgi:tetratricopeptide (TPR) repeat protein